jgi:hypothetical protein
MCDAVSAWDARAVLSHYSTLLLIDLHFDCFQAVARVAADQAAETRCMLQLRAPASHMTIFSGSTTSHAAHRGLLPRLWWSIGAGGRQL